MLQGGNFTVTGYNGTTNHNVTGSSDAQTYILYQGVDMPDSFQVNVTATTNGNCSDFNTENSTAVDQCAGQYSLCCYDSNAAHYQVLRWPRLRRILLLLLLLLPPPLLLVVLLLLPTCILPANRLMSNAAASVLHMCIMLKPWSVNSHNTSHACILTVLIMCSDSPGASQCSHSNLYPDVHVMV